MHSYSGPCATTSSPCQWPVGDLCGTSASTWRECEHFARNELQKPTMSRQNSSDGHLSVKQPDQNKLNKGSKLGPKSQDDDDTTALFQHSPETKQLEREYEAGCLPDEVYDRQLPAWRAGLRRFLIRCLKVESEWLANAQVSWVHSLLFWLSTQLRYLTVAEPDTRPILGPIFLLDSAFRQSVFTIKPHHHPENSLLMDQDHSTYLFHGRLANVLLVRRRLSRSRVRTSLAESLLLAVDEEHVRV